MNAFRITLFVAIGAAAVACTSPNPNTPSVSFLTPTVQGASNDSSFNFSDQPLSLKFSNSPKTGSATTTYSVEVSSDAGFSKKVFTKDGIAEDPSGATAFTVAVLPGNATYFWHSRAVVNNVPGQFSATASFSIRPQITIQAPAAISPANGSTATGSRPVFTTSDASASGPVATLFYNFQVASASSFASGTIVATGLIQEQPGQTSFSPSSDLATGSYFWRVQAEDTTNQVSSPFSSVARFNVVPFDMNQAIVLNSPGHLASWPATTNITEVDYGGGAVVVDFDKRQSPDRWPDIIPPGFQGPLEYTLGVCLNISAQWYCSAAIQYWFGRDPGASANIAQDWFYDPARWGPMAGYQPAEGETVGWFVCEGNCRNDTAGLGSPLAERSNVVLIPFSGNAVSYTFSGTLRAIRHR
jgi:hypothetical protein